MGTLFFPTALEDTREEKEGQGTDQPRAELHHLGCKSSLVLSVFLLPYVFLLVKITNHIRAWKVDFLPILNKYIYIYIYMYTYIHMYIYIY